MGVNHDSLVKVNMQDDSILTPEQSPLALGMAYNQPFFGSKGKGNTIVRKTGLTAFTEEFGDDLERIEKYGHHGLIASQILRGGAEVDACRLVDENSTASVGYIRVHIKKDENLPKYLYVAVDEEATLALSIAQTNLDSAKTALTSASAVVTSTKATLDTDNAAYLIVKSAYSVAKTNYDNKLIEFNATAIGAAKTAIGVELYGSGTVGTPDAGSLKYILDAAEADLVSPREVVYGVGGTETAPTGGSYKAYIDATTIADAATVEVSLKQEEFDIAEEGAAPTGEYRLNSLGERELDAGVVSGYRIGTTLDATNTGDVPGGKTFTIAKVSAEGTGRYGNDLGIKLLLSPERDGKRDDGRRYTLEVYDRSTGEYIKQGNSYENVNFGIDPDCTLLADSDAPEDFQTMIKNYKKTFSLPVEVEVYEETITDLLEYFENIAENTPAIVSEAADIDFISNRTVKGNWQPGFELFDNVDGTGYDEDYSDSLNTTVAMLVNGSDAGLDYRNYLTPAAGGYSDSVGQLTDVSAAKLAVHNLRQTLGEKYYRGEIDPSIYDARIVDSGITLDAWWDTRVKKVMAGYFKSKVRDDVVVYLDLGKDVKELNQVRPKAQLLAGYVDDEYGGVFINIHNGVTTDRTKEIRTTGNYEVATALSHYDRIWGQFTVHSGADAGGVRTMQFDFLPRVVADDLELQPLRDANLMFAMRLDKTENAYFMSDASQYVSKYSVLNSRRNVTFAGDIIRLMKKVLVRKSFSPKNVSGSITSATEELHKLLGDDYYTSSGIEVDFTVFQTRNDVIENTASVDVNIYYPGIVGGWNVTIHAKRKAQ